MNARLLELDGTLQLLLCTGSVLILSYAEAYKFLSNYDDQEYYSGDGNWDYEDVTMESYRGETIATVSNKGKLTIENAELLRKILNNKEIKYLTTAEYAALHGKQDSIIRRFCRAGRLPGAIQKGKSWLVPESTPYPDDERTRQR